MSEQQCDCGCGCGEDLVLVPIRGLSLAMDKSALGEGGGSAPGIDYSLEEQWTGRLWVDGKKIYQRTVICPALPNNKTSYHPLNIQGLDMLVDLWGTSKSDVSFLPLPHAGTTSQVALLLSRVSADEQNIRFTSNSNYAVHSDVFVTVQYTCIDR